MNFFITSDHECRQNTPKNSQVAWRIFELWTPRQNSGNDDRLQKKTNKQTSCRDKSQNALDWLKLVTLHLQFHYSLHKSPKQSAQYSWTRDFESMAHTYCITLKSYLSGVNFHAFKSFCACSSFSFVSSNSVFILWNTILTAGSSNVERSCSPAGFWDCFRSWICVYKENESGMSLKDEFLD